MKRALLAFIPTIAAIGIGASALVTSPIVCGCENTPMLLAAEAGLDPSLAHTFSAEQLQAGLNRMLVGRSRTPHELFAPNLSWCKHVSPAVAECFVPMSESWLLQKGFLVTLQTASGGAVQRAQVRPHWQSSSP